MPIKYVTNKLRVFGQIFRSPVNKNAPALLPKQIVEKSQVAPLPKDVVNIDPEKRLKASPPPYTDGYCHPKHIVLARIEAMLRAGGANEVDISKFLNPSNNKMYKFITADEFTKLMNGQKVTDGAKSHAKMTLNPNPHSSLQGEVYRVMLKDPKDLSPFVDIFASSSKRFNGAGSIEYSVRGGLDLAHVASIEHCSGGVFTTVHK